MPNTKYYYALEDIPNYSVVFVCYDEKSKKNMIYTSQDIMNNNQNNPNAVGVVKKQLKKNHRITENDLIITGTAEVNYIGKMPTVPTNVYVVKTWKNQPFKGYVAPLERDIIPFNFDSSFIIKVGTIYPIDHQNPEKDEIHDDLITTRVLRVLLSINNTSFDLYNIYTLDLLPNEKIYGRDFSYHDIGQALKLGLENEKSMAKFNTLIDSYTTQVPEKQLCRAIHDYCITLHENIPTHVVPDRYESRLMVCTSSGQVVFDSVNPLNLYDFDTEMCTTIPLITPNPFDQPNFNLFKSLLSGHLYGYIDIEEDNGRDFIGSVYMLTGTALYEMAQSCVNGVGIGSRFCKVTDTYNYNVSWYLGITESYNVNDAEALIVRLGWLLKQDI